MRCASALTLFLALFILGTAAFGAQEALIQRSIFLAFVIAIAFLRFPLFAQTKFALLGNLIDLILATVAVGSCLWVTINTDEIMDTLPTAGEQQVFMTVVLVIAVLELARRTIGLVFPTLVIIGLLYAFFGQYIPGSLGHRGFDIYYITEVLLLSDIGIWGTLLGVASTIIAVFVLFGAFLLHSGGGATFMDLAIRISGRSVGGAAKIATIASGLFGMVSGSAVGNVATTGAFTIPLMKRLRYPSALAGAVEAVASTGGQLAPPIMGAAAFIMAEIIGTSYLSIAAAATLPAVLFYFGVFATVHITAQQEQLGMVPKEQIPSWASVITIQRLAPIVLSFGGLAYGVLIGRSLPTSAFYGIIGAIAGMLIALLFAPKRSIQIVSQENEIFQESLDLSETVKASAGALFLARLRSALDEGATGLIIVGVLLAGAQILVSLINTTGIGITLSSMIVSGGGDSLFLVALIVAAICMVLGMGIPTTAAYVLVAATLAPALVSAGLEPISAHMFVFYYATLSVITPPVCVGVFVAAGIADEKWGRVAKRAVMLGAVTYVIPFLFILYPDMLNPGINIGYIESVISGIVFVLAFAHLFGGAKITSQKYTDISLWIIISLLATIPSLITLVISALAMFLAQRVAKRRITELALKKF